MLSIQGRPSSCCEGFTRREFIRVGAAGVVGLTLADFFRLKEAGAVGSGKAKSVIILWLWGGPTHIDTFDPKPEAPMEVKGPIGAIETNVPGIRIGEYLPKLAKHADKYALLRSVTHPQGDHEGAHYYMLTAWQPSPAIKFPSYGSVVAKMLPHDGALPPYVVIPEMTYFESSEPGYLGSPYRPFVVSGNPNDPNFRVPDIHLPGGVTTVRAEGRRGLLKAVNEAFKKMETTDAVKGMGSFYERAITLMSSAEAKKAFELHLEPDDVRNRYGRNPFGQGCLLARRLVEAGVKFVTVNHTGGFRWDNHGDIFNALRGGNCPELDSALSALLEDLHNRGLLDETVVVCMGEFGRTPRINSSAGRDHWPYVMSVLMAGGGIQGGVVVGESDREAGFPHERPIKPEEIAATIYKCLGIDWTGIIPAEGVADSFRRVVPNDAEPIHEIV